MNNLSEIAKKKVNELIAEGKTKTEISKMAGLNNLQHLNQLCFDKWDLSSRKFHMIMLNLGMPTEEIMEHIQKSL
jgi:hypothetical protein